jgi:hypothetical protein
MTSHLPEFSAPRDSVPVADASRAETWPRENGPSARSPRPTPTERNRYRTQVVEQVASDAGYHKISPALPIDEQRALREAASAFLKAMPASDRARVSSRDVRHLFSLWDVPITEAYALSAVAAGKRRSGHAPVES